MVKKNVLQRRKRGVSVIIKKNLFYSIFHLDAFYYPSIKIIGVLLGAESAKLLLINVYRHPVAYYPAFFNKLFNFINDYPNILIVGDVNVHHFVWHNAQEDQASRALFLALENIEFVILNNNASTVSAQAGFNKNVINLAIASLSVAFCVTYTESDCFDSDHCPVITLINLLLAQTNLYTSYA